MFINKYFFWPYDKNSPDKVPVQINKDLVNIFKDKLNMDVFQTGII